VADVPVVGELLVAVGKTSSSVVGNYVPFTLDVTLTWRQRFAHHVIHPAFHHAPSAAADRTAAATRRRDAWGTRAVEGDARGECAPRDGERPRSSRRASHARRNASSARGALETPRMTT
jgi:hypothetical protein